MWAGFGPPFLFLMNLSEATIELKARGASYLSNGRVELMLNDAKNDFEDMYPWPWLEATTSGPGPLEISDLKQVLYVVDSDRDNVLWGTTANDVIMQESWSDITSSATTGDSPARWYIDGATTLSVFPASTNNLYVRYLRFSPELSGTDTPLIPRRYHNLWLDFAMVRVYRDSDDLNRARDLLAGSAQRLAVIFNEYGARNLQNPTTQQIYGSSDW